MDPLSSTKPIQPSPPLIGQNAVSLSFGHVPLAAPAAPFPVRRVSSEKEGDLVGEESRSAEINPSFLTLFVFLV